MTAPSYTEDMTDIATGDEASGWTVFSTNQQGTPSYQDSDYPYIQGSYAVTQTCSKSKTLANLGYDSGGTITLATDGAYLVWQSFASAFAMDDYAGTTTGTAGMSILVGQDTSNFDVWYVGGQDVSPYPYGGFICHAVNTTVARDALGAGTKTADQVVGAQIALTSYPSKGEPHSVDVMRHGRCSAIFQYGEVADYATIAGFATQNDNSSNRWGLIQEVSGGYLWQGRMHLGTSTNAVDLRDSDVTIFIKYTPKVTANFNTVEVENSSSNVEMTGFNFVCLDPANTASKGRWITTNDATVALTSCNFTDMSTFDFDSNTTALSCIFRRCDQIDPQQADLSFSSVLESSATGGGADGGAALLWDVAADPNTYLNDMTFTKGAGSHHAIEFGTSAPQTINLTNMTFTDFSVSDQQTTSVLYFQDTGSDVTWTVNHSGTSGTVSYYKERSGDTVTISSSITLNVTVYDNFDGLIESGVQTAIYKTSDRTELMNEDTDGAGLASNNYTGAVPVEVEIRCRKASSGADVFKNVSTIQTIPSGITTWSFSVYMDRDPNNNATS